jgi:hypothetical protein
VWRGNSVEGYYDTRWLTGLLSTQTKVEGIMLKAAWHWGRDNGVVNYPHGEPGRTPFYIGLLSAWGSVDVDRYFPPLQWASTLDGDSERYE